MTASLPQVSGYIRADAQLAVLETAIGETQAGKSTGELSIYTADGKMLLEISPQAAADLVIDLQQFLKTVRT